VVEVYSLDFVRRGRVGFGFWPLTDFVVCLVVAFLLFVFGRWSFLVLSSVCWRCQRAVCLRALAFPCIFVGLLAVPRAGGT
jgi:hypothetical protein